MGRGSSQNSKKIHQQPKLVGGGGGGQGFGMWLFCLYIGCFFFLFEGKPLRVHIKGGLFICNERNEPTKKTPTI